MAIIKNFAGTTIVVPGSYTQRQIKLIGSGLSAETGRVAIVGESTGGAPGSEGILSFLPTQLSDLIDFYKDGPIVDAARAAFRPSNDSRIANGASRIYVYKTNNSTKSELALATGFGTLKSENYGQQENLLASIITKTDGTDADVQSGSSFDASVVDFQSGNKFDLRINGSVVNTFTFPAGINTIILLQAALDNGANWSGGLPSGITFTVSGADATASLQVSLDALSIDHQLGYGRNFELVENTGTPLATMNIAPNIYSSSIEPKVQLQTQRSSDEIDENSDDNSGDVGGKVSLLIGCEDTTCTLVITGTQLQTNAATLTDLTLNLSDFNTLQDLAEYINTQTGYNCSVPSGINGGLPPSVLDRVNTNIAVSISGGTSGRVKTDSYDVWNWYESFSAVVELERTSYVGLPDEITKTFFAGGTRGSSATSDFVQGFADLEGEELELVVPLISQDASDDLAEKIGYTDVGSTYDVESVIIALRNHCKNMSNVKNRKNRQGYYGYRGTFQECRDESLIINSEYVSQLIQDVFFTGTDGNLTWKQPFLAACIAAGMHAGGEIGQPTTFKYINCAGIRHVKKQGLTSNNTQESFNAGKQAETAILDGIMPLFQHPQKGIRIQVQNSTYSKDDSFVNNRPSVFEAVLYSDRILREKFEDLMMGTKSRTTSQQSVLSIGTAVLADLLKADIIVGDDTNGGLGYKDLSISTEGNAIFFEVTLTPVQGIDFVLNRLTLDTIKRTVT